MFKGFEKGQRVICADRNDDNHLLLIRGIISVVDLENDDIYVRLEAPYLEGVYIPDQVFIDTSDKPIVFGEY